MVLIKFPKKLCHDTVSEANAAHLKKQYQAEGARLQTFLNKSVTKSRPSVYTSLFKEVLRERSLSLDRVQFTGGCERNSVTLTKQTLSIANFGEKRSNKGDDNPPPDMLHNDGTLPSVNTGEAGTRDRVEMEPNQSTQMATHDATTTAGNKADLLKDTSNTNVQASVSAY